MRLSFEKVSFYSIAEKINASQVASILFSEDLTALYVTGTVILKDTKNR